MAIDVLMYTRKGCHLCDDAWRLLEELRRQYGFELQAIDVDTRGDLVKLHGERVPVVFVNGKEHFWGRVNRVLLERLIRKAR